MRVIEGKEALVQEPDWSGTYSIEEDILAAKEQWRILENAMLDAGTLAPENAAMMERYVNFKLIYDRANKVIAEKGIVINPRRGSRGGIARQNPSWYTMREAASDLDRMEAELGISPRRRGGLVKVTRSTRKREAADAYLAAVKK